MHSAQTDTFKEDLKETLTEGEQFLEQGEIGQAAALFNNVLNSSAKELHAEALAGLGLSLSLLL